LLGAANAQAVGLQKLILCYLLFGERNISLEINMKQKLVLMIIFIIMAGALLFGCRRPLQNDIEPLAINSPTITIDELLLDRSLLTDKPCMAPCWYGLDINKSTKDKVMETLKTLSFIDQNRIFESEGQYMIPNKNKVVSDIAIAAN
jgi:hypothetical protein